MMYQAALGNIRPAPISCCKVQKRDVQSDHQNLRVRYRRVHFKGTVT